MNERIRLLWDQAQEEIKAEYEDESRRNRRLYNEIFLPKFAELIIRECCRALNPMLRDMISRGQGVDLIKLHFGMDPKEITTAMLDAAIEQCKQELAKTKSGEE